MPSCCGQGRGLSSRCSRSSNLMYLCGKAIHVSRRAGKASKQLLGTPPGGYRRNVVEVQQHTTFPVDSRLPGVFQIAKWDSVPTSLSAVSEAPISRQVFESRCSGGARQIQRLEGSRPSREPMGFVELGWLVVSGSSRWRMGAAVDAQLRWFTTPSQERSRHLGTRSAD
jgi:hypothetical protein